MARVTKRDVPVSRSKSSGGVKRQPTTRPGTRVPAPSVRASQLSTPPAPIDAPSNTTAPKSERGQRGRDERLKEALEWQRFEEWCASNDLPRLPATSEALALVALYLTHLAATGRNAASLARALLRSRAPR